MKDVMAEVNLLFFYYQNPLSTFRRRLMVLNRIQIAPILNVLLKKFRKNKRHNFRFNGKGLTNENVFLFKRLDTCFKFVFNKLYFIKVMLKTRDNFDNGCHLCRNKNK